MSIFVIAECGINHSGSIDMALRLVDAAKESGADCAKFQMFSSRKLWHDDRIAHLELAPEALTKLHTYCKQIGIEFACTPFGVEEVAFLKPLLKRVKIASGCIRRKALLAAVDATGLPVILSTGMSELDEIMGALDVLNKRPITLLHCTSSYPCRLEDVHLNTMKALANLSFGINVGFSDHTSGITAAIAAVALGATVIEKHLTLDRDAIGPDHKASITPREFRAMRLAITEVEAAMGEGVKTVRACERELRKAWA